MGDLLGTLVMCLIVATPFALLALLITSHDAYSQPAEPGTWWKSLKRRVTRKPRRIGVSLPGRDPAGPLPPVLVSLAKAYAAGEACGFALHDALLEAGHTELAEPFRGPDVIQQWVVVNKILDEDWAARWG